MQEDFISVERARELLHLHIKPGKTIRVRLEDAIGCTLARDVRSPINLPPFDQSNVDGYAVRHEDCSRGAVLTVIDESAAGTAATRQCRKGTAIRIFTGAVVPRGADRILMQEDVENLGSTIRIRTFDEHQPSYIRPKASHIRRTELALTKGAILRPATVGMLAAMGLAEVSVYRVPTAAILISGSELQSPGTTLHPGFVFESNAITLRAALNDVGITNVKIYYAPDDPRELRRRCVQALRSCDFLLISGGISVGDYDYVYDVLRSLDVNGVFYKVRQRPGKPLFYGTHGNQHVFALPGNPASALTCFYEYVAPGLRRVQGARSSAYRSMHLSISTPYEKKHALTQFLRAVTDGKSVTILPAQESFTMRSYADANCLVCIPEKVHSIAAGELVEVHLLPSFPLES